MLAIRRLFMSLSFLSKSNPLISNVKKGKFLTPWFLAPFILYYITQYMSPISRASTNFFLDKQSWIPDWWNILDLWSFLYTIIAFFLWVKFIEKRPIRTMGFSRGNGLPEFAKSSSSLQEMLSLTGSNLVCLFSFLGF